MVNLYERLEKSQKDLYKANKTIITLCNYLNKSSNDPKALKRANKELEKSKNFIERENLKEKLLTKLIELSEDNEIDDNEKI